MRSLFGGRGDLAGKTGTTQDGADGWFLLMRPDLVIGAWVGFDDPRVTFRSSYWGQGGHTALRLVGDFNRTLQSDGLVDPRLAFPQPTPPEDRGPSLWGRFSGWLGDVADDVFGRDPDVPDDYGPRTPGRRVLDPDEDEAFDEWDRRDEILAENEAWLEDAWDELDRIEDPILRAVARSALAEAARTLRRDGDRPGWRDRVRDARDRALDEAVRQIERELERGQWSEEPPDEDPFFDDEEVLDDETTTELEEVPVVPEGDSLRSGDGGRIGF